MAGASYALSGLHSPKAQATDSSIDLLPGAGQFSPLSGTAVLDSRNGTGVSSPDLTPGSTLTFSVRSVAGTATGVPANASAVVVELNTMANFTGLLAGGAAAGSTDTSLTFPPDVERNGLDVVTPAADGTIALAIKAFSPIPAGAVLSKLVVRLHGYYSGAGATAAGSTYVGYAPTAVADSTASPTGFTLNGDPVTGPLTIGTPPGGTASNAYVVQATGSAGVPADGSATAVAVQIIVQDPTCTGGLALVPAGSGRTDYDGTYAAGVDGENFDVVALPDSGQLSLRLVGCSGTASVILRVRGYFTAPTAATAGSSYIPQRQKVFDTTNAVGTAGCATTADSPQIAAHSGCAIPVLGVGAYPSGGVSGIAAEVIAVNPTHAGWIGLWSDAGQAHTATLWYSPGGRTSNFEDASYPDVGTDGTLYVWNGGDYPVDIVVRAHGYERAANRPGTPTNVSVTTDGTTTTVSWRAPSADGGAAIGGFLVEGEDQSSTTVDWPTTTASFTGDQGDIGYSVSAVNGVGASVPGLSGCDAWRGAVPDAPPSDAPTADSSDTLDPIDSSKQAALSASPEPTEIPSESADPVVGACTSTSVDPTLATAIESDAVSDLHTDLYAMRQPQNSSGQRLGLYSAQGDTVTSESTMDAALYSQAQGASSAWASDVASAETDARYQDVTSAYADPDYVGYWDARTVVDQWQSLTLSSSTAATAVFVGHDSFQTSTGWHDDEQFQYELGLVLQSGHWRLESRTETGLGQDGTEN